jgi:hypothetical protein
MTTGKPGKVVAGARLARVGGGGPGAGTGRRRHGRRGRPAPGKPAVARFRYVRAGASTRLQWRNSNQTHGEVGGEILDMDLDPRPVGGEQAQGHAPFLGNQDGLVAVGSQRDLDDLLVLLAQAVGQEQPSRGPHTSTRPVPSDPLAKKW